MLPSSQLSKDGVMTPLPHQAQIFGETAKLHWLLDSIVQVEEHPSFDTVLLSSQASTADLTPFPQNERQVEGSPVQVYPISC